MSEIRISIDESNFRDLVMGKEIEFVIVDALPVTSKNVKVKIILKDIGYDQIKKAITTKGHQHHPPIQHTPLTNLKNPSR